MTTHRAIAHTNIALVKYWGKNPGPGNVPAMGSLSLTLDGFRSIVDVCANDRDSFTLNGNPAKEGEAARVLTHIELFRKLSAKNLAFRIESRNEVPTGSGLASSASGFAALTLALARAFGLNLDSRTLSRLARQGSGSAARSIFGGFVRMHGGPEASDETAFAQPVDSSLDVRMIVLQCAQGPKAIGSREAMIRVATGSIFYEAFVANHPRILEQALHALREGDLEQLGAFMEQSTLQMHATMLGCDEPFWYLNPVSVAALNRVRELRKAGYCCYFTMDAGPHVKVLCDAHEAVRLSAELESIDGVSAATVCAPGPSAALV